MNGTRENNNRIGRAKVAPGVPARTARNHLKAAAAQSLCDYRVRSGTVDDDAVSDGITPARCLKNMAHAAQIAFAFFSHIANEYKW